LTAGALLTDAEILAILIPMLRQDEGCRLTAYRDSLGIWTCGYGHAYVEPGTVWTQQEADEQLLTDATDRLHQMDPLMPWWRTLGVVRGAALSNMGYNLGARGLMGFPHMLSALETGDWQEAHDQALDSEWAGQVGARATRIANMFLTGERPG
jgi:lysozyme